MSMRFRRRRKAMSLQLTSLLDMFTIILVFLLESFQAQDEDFVLHAGLDLPESSARNPFKQAVNIAVDPTAVYVEGKKVYGLTEGAADPEDLDRPRVDPISDAIAAAWEVRKASAGEDEPVATVQADQDLPYETLDLVLRSAADAGCARFRLVIEKGG
jgi:biopolymer transport protein ExbD